MSIWRGGIISPQHVNHIETRTRVLNEIYFSFTTTFFFFTTSTFTPHSVKDEIPIVIQLKGFELIGGERPVPVAQRRKRLEREDGVNEPDDDD